MSRSIGHKRTYGTQPDDDSNLHVDTWGTNQYVKGGIGLTTCWITHHFLGGALGPKGPHALRVHHLGVGSNPSVTLVILVL